MYNVIVVPVDLAHTEKVPEMLKIARKLSKKKTKIILANVVEEIPAYVAAELPKGMIKNSKEYAAKALRKIASTHQISADIKVKSGHTASGILNIAEQCDADCIIIGSHRPGMADYFLGSTAARVVRHAQCTVHVVRHG